VGSSTLSAGSGALFTRKAVAEKLEHDRAETAAGHYAAAETTSALYNAKHVQLLGRVLAEPSLHPADREQFTELCVFMQTHPDRSLTSAQTRMLAHLVRRLVAYRMRGKGQCEQVTGRGFKVAFLHDPSLLPRAPVSRHAVHNAAASVRSLSPAVVKARPPPALRDAVEVAAVTGRLSRFRCLPLSATITAGACVGRQDQAGAEAEGVGSEARASRAAAARCYECRDCALGLQVRAQITLAEGSAGPASGDLSKGRG